MFCKAALLSPTKNVKKNPSVVYELQTFDGDAANWLLLPLFSLVEDSPADLLHAAMKTRLISASSEICPP